MPRAIFTRDQFAFAGVLVVLACLRLCFAGVLWSDEDYHMAAALHIVQGKLPYRDFWYDKPPLAAFYYLAMGAWPGVLLRLWDAAYVLLCCLLTFKLARSWWGVAEARVAAVLMAFFTTFYLPAAVIPFAPDALLLAPHLAAVYFARHGRSWIAGAICGLGFWLNVKALFVLAACAAWLVPSLLALVGGFAAFVALGAALLSAGGMLAGYWQQVWVWGLAYAAGAPVAHPLAISIERVGHWLGFHLALAFGWIAGAGQAQRAERINLFLWLLLSFAAVCFGNHFAPRYFLQLLPPLAVVGARGLVCTLRQKRVAIPLLAVSLLIPFIRFAPRYWLMARHAAWADITLDVDSQLAAAHLNALSKPGDTLFVWGYRPDLYVYTRLNIASLFWDSQPLTGVAADRHLNVPGPVVNAETLAHLQTVERSRPTFFVDGLGPLNGGLKPQNFPSLRALLNGYHQAARTRLSIIYQRND